MDTVERLVSADHADFKPARIERDRASDSSPLRELDRLMADSKGERK
jgi:hypothetical protein